MYDHDEWRTLTMLGEPNYLVGETVPTQSEVK